MKKRILIIEDDQDVSDILRFLANQLNFEVSTSDRTLFVADIKRLDPDLIVLDHWLGTALGGDLCQALKSKESTRDIPVILISADPDLIRIAQECSADAWLAKPFDVDELLGMMTDLLSKKVGTEG